MLNENVDEIQIKSGEDNTKNKEVIHIQIYIF